jgi:hypothetical protein
MRRFRPGEVAVRRGLFRRKVWSAHALRVAEDTTRGTGRGAPPRLRGTHLRWVPPEAWFSVNAFWSQGDWKDEDEYAQGRRLGVVSPRDHRAVGAAREEAVAMIGSRGGPFAAEGGWRNRRPAPDTPAPPCRATSRPTVSPDR